MTTPAPEPVAASTVQDATTADDGAAHGLADRYGTAPKTVQRRRNGRIALWTLGIAGTIAAGWMGWSMAVGDDFAVQDYGFSILSPERAEASIIVSKNADITLTCRFTALNTGYAEVGSREVQIGLGKSVQEKFTVELKTSEEATTALLDNCRKN